MLILQFRDRDTCKSFEKVSHFLAKPILLFKQLSMINTIFSEVYVRQRTNVSAA